MFLTEPQVQHPDDDDEPEMVDPEHLEPVNPPPQQRIHFNPKVSGFFTVDIPHRNGIFVSKNSLLGD